jgi:hypothetical protein
MGPGNQLRPTCRRARFADALVADLRSLATAAIGQEEGTETGGILLGEIIGEELRLHACEEVPCERPGPCYTLGASDRIRLEEVLASRRGACGFFRTFLTQTPTPQDADLQFVQRYFPRGECMYMMLRAESADRCVATVVWFRDGQPITLDGPATFPLEPGGVPMLRVRPALPLAFRSMPAAAQLPEAHPRVLPVLGCLLLGVLGGAGYGYFSADRVPDAQAAVQPPKPKRTDLQLDARASGRQIDIKWNPDAIRVLNANSGRLTVTDGRSTRDLPLGAALLKGGRYRYNAAHSNLAVHMLVQSDGRTVGSESVSLTSAVADVPAPEPQPVSPEPVPPRVQAAAAVPPAPLHQVQPEIPDGIRHRLVAEVVIPVEVKVNERGRVLSAQADNPYGDGLRRYLAGQAEKAAREWQFSPARSRSGSPVVGNQTIQFVITP